MRLGWIGFHREGLPAFQGVLEAGAPLHAAITLPSELAATRSGATDYAPLCRRFHVPRYDVVDVNDPVPRELLRLLALDVVFVIGWSQILDAETIETARIGMIGARPSLLSQNQGNASSDRAWIRGECAIANSLVWLGEAGNGGMLIDQTEFPITPYDTCRSLYERVAAANRAMVLRVLPRLLDGAAPLGAGPGHRRGTAGPGPTPAAGRWPHPRAPAPP